MSLQMICLIAGARTYGDLPFWLFISDGAINLHRFFKIVNHSSLPFPRCERVKYDAAGRTLMLDIGGAEKPRHPTLSRSQEPLYRR